jgi:hypothetical protein
VLGSLQCWLLVLERQCKRDAERLRPRHVVCRRLDGDVPLRCGILWRHWTPDVFHVQRSLPGRLLVLQWQHYGDAEPLRDAWQLVPCWRYRSGAVPCGKQEQRRRALR